MCLTRRSRSGGADLAVRLAGLTRSPRGGGGSSYPLFADTSVPLRAHLSLWERSKSPIWGEGLVGVAASALNGHIAARRRHSGAGEARTRNLSRHERQAAAARRQGVASSLYPRCASALPSSRGPVAGPRTDRQPTVLAGPSFRPDRHHRAPSPPAPLPPAGEGGEVRRHGKKDRESYPRPREV